MFLIFKRTQNAHCDHTRVDLTDLCLILFEMENLGNTAVLSIMF